MDLYIGENIKRLRLAKNVTQEKIAEYLNVSVPAVSKWERGETLPDITLVLPLASYFGVSADELLRFDITKLEEDARKRHEEYVNLLTCGKWEESKKFIVAAHKEFPNDFSIMIGYMQQIIGGLEDTKKEVLLQYGDEFLILCERILDECKLYWIRYTATDIAAKICKARDDNETAFKYLYRFPDSFFYVRGERFEQFYDKRTDQWWYWINKNLFDLSYLTIDKIGKSIWYSKPVYDPDMRYFNENIAAIERLIVFIQGYIDATGYEPLYFSIAKLYGMIAGQCSANAKDPSFTEFGLWDKACGYYDVALHFSKLYDDFIASDRQIEHTSQNIKYFLTISFSEMRKHNAVKALLLVLDNAPTLSELRETERFRAILNKYRPYALDIPTGT